MKSLILFIIWGALTTGFANPIQSQHAAVARIKAGGGGGVTPVSPGTGSLLAWYDFAGDATDIHAAYDITTEGSPAYTGGSPSFVTFTSGSRAYIITGLSTVFNNAAGDCSFVIRWRAHTSLANNSDALVGGRFRARYSTAGNDAQLSNVTVAAAAGSIGVWYTTVASWNETTDTLSISYNGASYTTGTGTVDYSTNTIYLPSYVNIEIDFAAFYNKQLTQANVEWLYNSNGTRAYADL